MENCIIAVNVDSAVLFKEFAFDNPDYIVCVEHKSFSGFTQIIEFIVNITPECLTALSAYLIAKLKTESSITIEKGDIKIELHNMNITPEEVLGLLRKLEEHDDE